MSPMRETILTTDRTRVTTWVPEDIGDLHRLHSDPAVMRYLPVHEPETREQSQRRLEGYLEDQRVRGWTKWRVADRSEDPDGTMIGRAGFSPYGEGRELGYILGRESWGRGLATELARALVAWDAANPLDPPRDLIAFAVDENAASRNVLTKAGFTFTEVREHEGRPFAFHVIRR